MRHLSWIPVFAGGEALVSTGAPFVQCDRMDAIFFKTCVDPPGAWFVEISSEIVRRWRRGSPDKEFSDALYVHSQIRPPWSADAGTPGGDEQARRSGDQSRAPARYGRADAPRRRRASS